MTLAKDDSIRGLVSRLEHQRRGWLLVDHWEADLCAIGVTSAAQPRRLVYVSTYNNPPGMFDYECEVSTGAQPSDYATVASGEDVSFAELVVVLELHLEPQQV